MVRARQGWPPAHCLSLEPGWTAENRPLFLLLKHFSCPPPAPPPSAIRPLQLRTKISCRPSPWPSIRAPQRRAQPSPLGGLGLLGLIPLLSLPTLCSYRRLRPPRPTPSIHPSNCPRGGLGELPCVLPQSPSNFVSSAPGREPGSGSGVGGATAPISPRSSEGIRAQAAWTAPAEKTLPQGSPSPEPAWNSRGVSGPDSCPAPGTPAPLLSRLSHLPCWATPSRIPRR